MEDRQENSTKHQDSASSAEDIELRAMALLRDRKVMAGMSLVLGYEVDESAVMNDKNLAELFMLGMQDPEKAYGRLVLMLTEDKLEAEG
jgi:hypothetical protein